MGRHLGALLVPLVGRFGIVAGLSLLPLLACSKTDEHPPAAEAANSTPFKFHPDERVPPAADLTWERCSLSLEDASPSVAECATLTRPLRTGEKGTRTINISVKRYRSTGKPRGQLWLVNGGPGASGGDFEASIALFLSLAPELELYFFHARGTGESTLLDCPKEQAGESLQGESIADAEWPACIDSVKSRWGADLAGFSTTETARDLAELLARTRHAEDKVFVYGVSYGTYLVHRLLQLDTTPLDGVVLDSICPPGGCDFLREFDRGFDAVGKQLFDLCAKDYRCSGELGADPWKSLGDVLTKLDAGHCAELKWDRQTTRQLLGLMTMVSALRGYAPAIVARLSRCQASDITALHALESYLTSLDMAGNGYSEVLYSHVALSELSTRPFPTVKQVADADRTYRVSLDAADNLLSRAAIWPLSAPDPLAPKYASTDVPLLMLNGDFDPQTPLSFAQEFGRHFAGKYQHFVVVPFSPHTTLTQSDIDSRGNTCGAELIRDFLGSPLAVPKLTCLGDTLPPDFSGQPAVSEVLFQTNDPYNAAFVQELSADQRSAQAAALRKRLTLPLSGPLQRIRR